jgi:hypothetical protein
VIFLHIFESGNELFRLETTKVSLNFVFCIKKIKFFSAVFLFLSSTHGKQQNCWFGFVVSEFPSSSTWSIFYAKIYLEANTSINVF